MAGTLGTQGGDGGGHGVSGGREGGDEGDDDHGDDDRAQRHMLQELPDTGHSAAVLDGGNDVGLAADLPVQRGAAPNGKPHKAKAGGQQEVYGHELAHGAAIGDHGEEDAHQGGVGDPDGPVIHGPPGDQGGAAHHIGIKAPHPEAVQPIAQTHVGHVQDIHGGPNDEQQDQQHIEDLGGQTGQPLDALVHAGNGSDGKGGGDDGGEDDPHHRALGHAIGGIQTGADQRQAGAQRGGQTQSDGQHGQHIDEHHPDALGDLVAEQGGEGGGHGQVLFAVEVHIGDEHAGQGVHGIGDHGPVIEAAAHGKPGGLVRQGLDAIAVQLAVDVAEVDQHLVHAIGDQAGGDTAGQGHGEPGTEGVLGLGLGAAEADLAHLAEGQHKGQGQRDHGHHLIQPAEGTQGPAEDGVGHRGQPLVVDDAQNGSAAVWYLTAPSVSLYAVIVPIYSSLAYTLVSVL